LNPLADEGYSEWPVTALRAGCPKIKQKFLEKYRIMSGKFVFLPTKILKAIHNG